MEDYQIASDTRIGWVELRVSNLEQVGRFYGGVVGFRPNPISEREMGPTSGFSPTGQPPYPLYLIEDPAAPPRPSRTSGLYHTAIRFPSRAALGQVLRRIAIHQYPLGGVADHGVSEALYLSDPDENGVELYADRPRDEWKVQDGQVEMFTESLDMNALLQDAGGGTDGQYAPPGTDIGHIHLQVADLDRSKSFYHGLLGLDITQESYRGALFLSAGGYHHHVGLNVWGGRGVPPPPPNALGLSAFALELPDRASLDQLAERISRSGYEFTRKTILDRGEAIFLQDPDRINLYLTVKMPGG